MFKDIIHSFVIFVLSLSLMSPNVTVDEPVVVPEEPKVTVEYENDIEPTVFLPTKHRVASSMEMPDIELTEDEVYLVAWCMVAEAEGEPEEGKRLVIDVIFNRVFSDEFANSIYGVVYEDGQFEAMYNGRAERCQHKVTEEMLQLVREEAQERTNSNVLYFRTKHYHTFGTPEVHVGKHYFSS